MAFHLPLCFLCRIQSFKLDFVGFRFAGLGISQAHESLFCGVFLIESWYVGVHESAFVVGNPSLFLMAVAS